MSHHARQKHDILKCPYEDKFPKEGGFFKTGWAVMSHDSSRITHTPEMLLSICTFFILLPFSEGVASNGFASHRAGEEGVFPGHTVVNEPRWPPMAAG